jgi:hypothetical protein
LERSRKEKKMVTKKGTLLLIVALLATPVGMFANSLGATVWNLSGLSDGPPPGSISWGGNSADPLIGSGIVADGIDGSGTPFKAGAANDLIITNGSLGFTTGANSYNGFLGSTWSWGVGSGATLRMTGCIAAIGLSGTCSNNVLLEDSFQDVQITPGGGGLNLLFGGISGTINQSVANYFGLGNNTAFTAASVGFTVLSTATEGYAITDVSGSAAAFGGSINAAPAPLPEPSGLLLMTIGMAGLLVWRGRKTSVVC